MVPENSFYDNGIAAKRCKKAAKLRIATFKGFWVSIRSKNAMEILLNKLGGGKWNNCQILERRK